MRRLKCSFRGIAVVSAAICWFFSAVQPTLASTLIVIPSPTLTADPTSLYPGDPIEISGSSFSQCERHATGPNVVVYWDGTDWTKATAFHSGFSVNATAPSYAPAGSHEVTAACYDPAATVSSLPLASAEVQVLPGPALQLSTSEAAADSSVTAAGTGFGQCPRKGLGDDVQLLWDAAPLGGPVGLDGNGAFSQDVIIPAAAAPGTGHTVAAECYDPAIGSVTSGVLASQPFTVTPPPSTSAPASTPPTTPVTSPAPRQAPWPRQRIRRRWPRARARRPHLAGGHRSPWPWTLAAAWLRCSCSWPACWRCTPEPGYGIACGCRSTCGRWPSRSTPSRRTCGFTAGPVSLQCRSGSSRGPTGSGTSR